MASFFKGNQLYRQDSNDNYLKVNDIIPVNHWKLQEASGTDVNDGGSNPETLTNSNATVNQTGKISKAYDFVSSSSSRLSGILNNPVLSQITLACWVNLDGSANNEYIVYINKGTNSLINLRKLTDNKLRFYVRDVNGDSNYFDTASAISLSTWVHLIATYNSFTDELKLYINNELNNSDDSVSLSTLESYLVVNIGSSSTPDTFLNGLVEDIRIYDYILSEQEIATIYNAGNGTLSNSLLKVYPTVQEPVNHWKLQEESGTDVNDGGSDPITLVNTNATVNQTGIIDKSYAFDASTAYVYGTLSDSVKTASGSISLWANFGTVANVQEDALSIADDNADTRFAIRRKSTQEVLEAYMRIGASNKWFIEAATQLTNGGWKHIVITHDGTAPKLYIDGVDVTVVTGSVDLTAWIADGTFDNISFGSIYFSATRFIDFEGNLEDIRLYNYALSDQEIKNLYNNDKGLLL